MVIHCFSWALLGPAMLLCQFHEWLLWPIPRVKNLQNISLSSTCFQMYLLKTLYSGGSAAADQHFGAEYCMVGSYTAKNCSYFFSLCIWHHEVDLALLLPLFSRYLISYHFLSTEICYLFELCHSIFVAVKVTLKDNFQTCVELVDVFHHKLA